MYTKTIYTSLTGNDSLTTVQLINGLGIEYIRVAFYVIGGTGANAIVTVNQEITE